MKRSAVILLLFLTACGSSNSNNQDDLTKGSVAVSLSKLKDACGDRKLVLGNLYIAAEMLPLPSSYSTIRPRKDLMEPSQNVLEMIRESLEENQGEGHFSYGITGKEMEIRTWSEMSKKDGTYGASFYRFPRGSLQGKAAFSDLYNQLKQAASDGKLSVRSVESVIPVISQKQYNDMIQNDTDAWPLTAVLKDYQKQKEVACVQKEVPHLKNGKVEMLNLPMLELRPDSWVGFLGAQDMVTFRKGRGGFSDSDQATWFRIEGVSPNQQ